MSGDPEDDDHKYFMRLGGTDDGSGEEAIVSRAAFQLHGFGVVNSVQDGQPGFISDDYLNALSAETTITAAELCTAGLWRRAEGGYEVLDRGLVEMVEDQEQRQAEAHELCAATGGHEPRDDEPDLCRKCLAWRPTAADWPDD